MYQHHQWGYYNPYHYEGYYYRQESSQLINDLQRAINGEYSAVSCYEKLSEMALTKQVKDQILEIREDERRHLATFSKIYTSLTGRQPSPQLIEACPDTFKEGLEYAFRDEQETVDFYLDVADKAQDMAMKEAFRRAAADEQNHAVWFSFFFSKQQVAQRERQGDESFGAKGALQATTLRLPEMLTFALEDEYLAQARYNTVLGRFGNVRTFVNIKAAEMRHIQALLPLFERYRVPLPEDKSSMFTTVPATIKEAYRAGVQGEIDNIAMYNKFLTFNIPQDVRLVFTRLRNASQNHLAAFERGLARNVQQNH